jgi:PAS domain S-box-containing protein
VAVALFTGALGWYAVSTMERMNDGQHTVYGDIFGGTHLLATWVDTSWESRADLLDVLLTEDPAKAAEDRADMGQFDGHLAQLALQMDQADTDREDVATLAALESAWNSYITWRDQTVLGQLDRGDRAGALAAYNADGARMGATVDNSIDAFLSKKREVGARLESEAEASFDLTRRIAILLSIAAAGLGLGVGFFLSRSIARGVGQVATAAEGLAVGDLDQRITLDTKDEIGSMAGAVRDMIAYQQEMARVAHAIAQGDLTQNVKPKAPTDQLGIAFEHMISNLRTLVGQLEEAVRRANQLAEVAEEREERMRAVLDSVADAIITFDEQGRIETVNPTTQRMFGHAAEDLIGQDVGVLLAEKDDTLLVLGTRNELAGRRSDGSLFPLDLVVSEMRLAGRRLSIASVRDITERKQADAKFRGLLESAPDAIVTVSRDGLIALVNTQAERLFGYDRSELLGQPVEILLPERVRAAHVRHRPRYLKEPSTRSMGGSLELVGRRKDGTEFPVEISLSPLQSEDGILTTSVIRDITERKQAEDAQRFLTEASTLLARSLDYETTLASIARLAVPSLADGCIVEVLKEEDSTQTLSTVAVVEPEGVRLDGVLGDLSQKVVRNGKAYTCSRDTADDESSEPLDRLWEAGFSAVMVVPLVVGGRPLGVISFVATRTGRNYGSKSLGLAEELAHRCALAMENARLYQEAQHAIGLRDDFFSVASHELKTPVAALLAYTQFMLKRAERQRGLNREQIDEALEEVHWQSDRIGRLVAQLLDTSRLDAGKLALDPEATDLNALVRAAVYTARSSSPRHTITVQAMPGTWAMVDPVRLEQVITNLVDNAIKYSPDGGAVDVCLAPAGEGSICLTVTDHGIGIPAEHLPHVFDRFYQAHAGQHFAGVAGMGLGLYISRRIVEMHGGSIEIDAPPEGGARVTVTLPVGSEGEPPQPRRRRPGLESAIALAFGGT